MMLLFMLYTLLTEGLYFLLSPVIFAWLGHKTNGERLAINYPRKHYPILAHAASVGEINGIKQLLIDLLNTHPELHMLLTTNTRTGRKAASGLHPRLDVMLSPLDIMHLRLKQFMLSRPQLVLVAETEIWPALLYTAKLKKVPIVFINARISQRTLRNYMQFRPGLNWLGTSIQTICAQTDADRKRFSMLFDAECINAGNLKFSITQTTYDKAALRKEWGYQDTDRIVVLGSSRPGEEKILLQSYTELKVEFPELKLIIVPRHLERLAELETLLSGAEYSRFSTKKPAKDIHLIDEMGQLLPAYAMCDIAIVGGSFQPFGGHNPLEAAYYSKIILMGPHYESCRGSVRKLKQAEAILISSQTTLTQDLRKVLSDLPQWQPTGERAKQVLVENSDSLPRHLEVVNRFLETS
jgi:3-deoxy-D-manno-octulosonic-acid transferase